MPTSPHTRHVHSRRIAVVGASLVTVAALLLAACSSGGSSNSKSGATAPALPSAAQSVVDSAPYEFGSWSWDAIDLDTGKTLWAKNENTVNFLGSTTKLFTVGTFLDQFGPDATLETPVYATGARSGGSLQGDLVLVGSGDFILGSRGVLSGDLQWKSPDHVYAYASPLAEQVAADPLAGLDALAAQVKASGITSVSGDVLVDDRLWNRYESKEGVVSPIMVNDNVLDMQVHPGAAAGDRATVGIRPQTAYFDVVNEVVTIAAGGDASVTTTLGADNRIVLRGELPTDAATYNIATFAPDPAAYARALFIEALRRAGVTVNSSLTVATGTLPAENGYTAPNKVAALKSPPTSVLSKLVLKVSHNRGAESLMCLLAVKAGSKDCDTGLQTMIDTIGKAGVDQRSVLIYDGEGSDPASATPAALLRWLTWADGQSWSDTYRLGLPDLNDDGKILAKSGTSARPENPPMPSLFVVQGEAGYMTTASGKRVVMAVYASNATYPTVAEGLAKGANAVKAVTSAMQRAG